MIESNRDIKPRAVRMDRRYRCGRCEELGDPQDHDGTFDRETGQPICPACASVL